MKFNNDDNIILTNLKVFSEKTVAGQALYYMSASYTIENQFGIYELYIPKMALDIKEGRPTIITSKGFVYVDLGFGELVAISSTTDGPYTLKTIKEFKRKMTLSDIEKELGYKIELIPQEDK